MKEHLKKRHVISFFTTPENLQTRIMHDVPMQLGEMGVEVKDGLIKVGQADDAEVLRMFSLLPKLFSGRQVFIEFIMKDAGAAVNEDCAALDLEAGATIVCYNVSVSKSGETLTIYGEREIALALLAVAKGSIVTAEANTAFGEQMAVEWTEDGPIAILRAEKGLAIREILGTRLEDNKK